MPALRRALVRYLAFPLIIALASSGTVAWAQDDSIGLARLANSPILKKIMEAGDWKTDRQADVIGLTCVGCDERIELEITAEAVFDPDAPGAPFGRYVAKRETYCAMLERDGKGRCVSTAQIGWRWMVGFRSIAALADGRREVEYIYFDTPAGLRAVVRSAGGGAYTGAIEQLAELAVVRMSSAW